MSEAIAPATLKPATLEPSFSRTLAIWWAWTWRYVLFSFIAGWVVALPRLGFMTLLGATAQTAALAGNLFTYATSAAIQIFTLWNLFEKRFGSFELRVAEKNFPEGQPLERSYFAPDLKDALEIWWAWMWRTLLCALGAGVCAGALLVAVGLQTSVTPPIMNILGVLIWLPVSALVLKRVLGMSFSHFKPQLVPSAQQTNSALSLQ